MASSFLLLVLLQSFHLKSDELKHMKSIFLAFVTLCLCYGAYAEEHLDEISRDHIYTVEICFDNSQRFVEFDTTKALGGFAAKIVYANGTPSNKRFIDLVNVLKKHSPREGKTIDVRWSICVRDEQGKEISVCCLDAWGSDGYMDGIPVKFSNDLAVWLRKYLTEAFNLKNDPIQVSPK